MRNNLSGLKDLVTMPLPILKCNVFSTKNIIIAAGKAFSPNANKANGKPILPELLNIIGGRKTLNGQFIIFIIGNNIRAVPKIIIAVPIARSAY